MRKFLRPQDVLLLGLSAVADLFQEFQDPFGVLSKGYESMHGWVPHRFRKKNYHHLVWRSLRTGYIEKVTKNGEVYLRLTTNGAQRIKRDFPILALQKKPWDKKWRVVTFDIQEVHRQARERFREKLKELGFGMLHKSVFISPHDVLFDFSEFVEEQGLSDAVFLMEVSHIMVGDVKKLASKLWKLDELNESYRKIIEKIERNDLTIIGGRRKQLNMRDVQNRKVKAEFVQKIRREYLEVVLNDPFLPKELLPYDWKGVLVKDYIKKLRK